MKTLLVSLSLLTVTSASFGQAADLHVFTNTKGQTIKAKLLSAFNGQVTMVREDGQTVTFAATLLSPADQAFVKQTATAAPPKTAFMAKPNPADKLTPDEVNALVGLPLFSDTQLWQSSAAEVAEKMKLREESKTTNQSSYRLYPKEDLRLFGAHPYSVALYAENDKVTTLSLVFANKGDLFSAKGSAELHFDKNTPPAEAAMIVKTAMAKDIEAISSTLSKTLGVAKKERFGEGKTGRMNMHRWDWRGHAILLAEAEGEYVGLQIVTSAMADAGGKVARTSDTVIRERAKANVEQRKGGDVVINDIPMVDQGPKGYCVPATAERAMRYLGVPADMYILANAGETGYGGGTSVELLLQGVGRDIKHKGRSFDSWSGEFKLKELAKHIDKGVPVMWALYSTKDFNDTANKRMDARKQVTEWAAWKAQVTSEAASHSLEKDKETGHVVLIIGYNKDTNEIAFSDSWGERFKERWITIAEAEQVSQKRFYVVGF